jgi:hypothetical protein
MAGLKAARMIRLLVCLWNCRNGYHRSELCRHDRLGKALIDISDPTSGKRSRRHFCPLKHLRIRLWYSMTVGYATGTLPLKYNHSTSIFSSACVECMMERNVIHEKRYSIITYHYVGCNPRGIPRIANR